MLGGWIITFMLHVRRATPYASGVIGMGFWAGMTVGRSALGFTTHYFIELTNAPVHLPAHQHKLRYCLRLTERSIITVYIACAIGLELLFWRVPSIISSAVAVVFLGMFLGPLYPSGVIVATKLLPGHLHIPSLGFSTALGGIGGAVFPFLVGAIAQAKGIQILQPIIFAMVVILLVVWLCFPNLEGRVGLDREE
jgi:fucose permease